MVTLKEFLRSEVVPALGCTEPGAVALAVARARKEANFEEVKKIDVVVSANIYKNGYAVGIPGTKGLKGNVIAAALGAICGNYECGLEVLKCCNDDDVKRALHLVDEGLVIVSPDLKRKGVYVQATITTERHVCTCIIEDTHTNISKVKLDGRLILSKKKRFQSKQNAENASITGQIKNMTFKELTYLIDEIDEADTNFIFEGVKMNMAMSQAGLDPKSKFGLGVGRTIMKLVNANTPSTLPQKIKAYTAAAVDARMAGVSMPVMSSAGSGNHGITAILPVYIVAEFYNKTREETAKAIALSHLTTSFLKSRTGRLSPICGCTVAAGAGAAAGITYLFSDDIHKIEKAIEIHVSNLIGMICDGAKDTCALKVGTGACEAFVAAMMALEENRPEIPQGVLGMTLEETAENLASLSNRGMKDVDSIIIELLSKNNP